MPKRKASKKKAASKRSLPKGRSADQSIQDRIKEIEQELLEHAKTLRAPAFKKRVTKKIIPFERENVQLKKKIVDLEKLVKRKDENFRKKITELNDKNVLLKNKLDRLDVKPLKKQDFNRFLSESISDLQGSLKEAQDNYEFIIKDVEVEASVVIEERAKKPVFIIPTSEQLADIDPARLQKLKYSLTLVNKDE